MFDLIVCASHRDWLETAFAQRGLTHLLVPLERDPLLEVESEHGWMGYLRAEAAEVETLRDIGLLEILAIVPFTGAGTADALYHQLFADAYARQRYERLYPPSMREGSGPWFGAMRGA